MGIRGSSTNCGSLHWGGGGEAGRVLKRISLFTDSYSVAFRRQKRGDAEDFGKGMRGAQRVMGRTNSGKACFPPSSPQSFARRLKATGYESGLLIGGICHGQAHLIMGPLMDGRKLRAKSSCASGVTGSNVLIARNGSLQGRSAGISSFFTF